VDVASGKEISIDAFNGSRPKPSLDKVLDGNRQAQVLVQHCAEELSTVNSDFQRKRGNTESPEDIDDLIQRNAAVEDKVQQAADRLIEVNYELAGQIVDQSTIEQELEYARAQEEISRHASLHDSLTGLPNRALFSDRLEHGLAQARRHGWPLVVLFIDLDGFKSINDRFGHAVGDTALKLVARRLAGCSRKDDTVSRYGGDEFIQVLMEVQDLTQVEMIARKVLDSVCEPWQIEIDGAAVQLSIPASMGIAMYPDHGETADDLFNQADRAMYRAKRAGGGYAFADSGSAARPTVPEQPRPHAHQAVAAASPGLLNGKAAEPS